MYAKRRRGLGLVSITIRCSRTVIKRRVRLQHAAVAALLRA
jgi:hypothetical protein